MLDTSATAGWRNGACFGPRCGWSFGTWCISAACVQTTGQVFPTGVHPLVFTEH